MKEIKLFILLILLFIISINAISQDEINCITPFVSFPLLIPINTNNYCSGPIICSNDKIVEVNFRILSGTQPFIVRPEDIKCLPSLKTLTFTQIQVTADFIYQQFQPPLTRLFLYSFQDIGGISQSIKPLDFLLIKGGLQNKVLKLSNISRVKVVFMLDTIYVDGSDAPPQNLDYNLNQISFYLKNMPDLTYYPMKTIQLFFDSTLDYNMVSNFSTFNISGDTRLYHSNTQPFYAHTNFKIKSLYIQYNNSLSKPNGYISLSDNTNYETLSITYIGPDFNIDGNFPLISIPKTTNIEITGGNFSITPPISTMGSPSTHVSFVNCNITSLDLYTGSGKSYDFTNNSITGTIDQSYCTTNLIVVNNSMIGEIPSCYACYFNDELKIGSLPIMFERFAGNSFSNLNKTYNCTTFAPKIEIVSISQSKVRLTGTDIGFNSLNWVDQGTPIQSTHVEIIKLGKEYIITLPKTTLSNSNYFSIYFALPIKVVFTFPVINRPPLITSVKVESNTKLVISGSFFSTYYGYVTQSVYAAGFECMIPNDVSIGFFDIECTTFLAIPESIGQLIQISTGDYSKRVRYNTNQETNNRKCPNECTNDDQGVCNLSTGLCECEPGYLGLDCSEIQCEVPDCNSHGRCDTVIGECKCVVDYMGQNCTIPIHYVSSINTSTTEGGPAVLEGFFGDLHFGLSITIGGLDCPIISISSGAIGCIAPAGNGVKKSIITQNSIQFPFDYSYNDTNKKCQNDCSGNGVCDTSIGQCNCKLGYNGFDCSNPTNPSTTTTNGDGGNPPTNTTVDPSTGGTDITNQEIQFRIYFNALSEIDINGNVVRNYPLQNSWKFNSSKDSSSIEKVYTLTQSLQDNGSCIVVSNIEEIISENGKEFTFADTTFKLDGGSIKFSITISNYTYLSNLNTLQLELISSVDKLDKDDDNGCNEKDAFVQTDNLNDLSNFNYIKISKNNKVLAGRFINRVMSDGRSTYLGSKVSVGSNNESVIVILSLPHFSRQCIIDPDFSVLISPDFKTECPSDSKSRNWVIPIAVILPVVGVSTIIAVSYLMYRKKFVENDLQRKLKKINN